MYKACVIGDGGSIYGFAAAGFDIIDANAESFEAQFDSAVKSGRYGAVFVTDELFGLVPQGCLGGSALPLVMPVSLSSEDEKRGGKTSAGSGETGSKGGADNNSGEMSSVSSAESSSGEISSGSDAENIIGEMSSVSGGRKEKSRGAKHSLKGCGMDRLRQICERATGGSAVFDSLEKERDKFDKGGN